MIGPETMNTPAVTGDEEGASIVMSPDDIVKTKMTIERGRDAGDDTSGMKARPRIDNDVENEEREGHADEHAKKPRRMARTSMYRSNHLLHTMISLAKTKTKIDPHPRELPLKTKVKKNKEPNPLTTASCPD